MHLGFRPTRHQFQERANSNNPGRSTRAICLVAKLSDGVQTALQTALHLCGKLLNSGPRTMKWNLTMIAEEALVNAAAQLGPIAL